MARRVRGVYGKPWSKMAGNVPLSREVLNRLGEKLVEYIVKEAKKDIAKQGYGPTPRKDPEGLPSSERFLDSFSHSLHGQKTVIVTSTWPWIEQMIDGRPPFKMTWLTGKQRGYPPTKPASELKPGEIQYSTLLVPMMQRDGTVIVRYAPFRTEDAWVHPGFARHTFIERGVKKAREAMAEIILEEVVDYLAQGDPFR